MDENVKIVKVVSKNTFTNKNGEVKHYENWYIVFKRKSKTYRIPFIPNYALDNSVFLKLELVCEEDNN